MFDIGAAELLLIIIVAVVVIGPRDMPAALRTAGRWIGKIRRVSGHFRAGIDAMVREAEMEEMERKWRAQNEKVMRQYPHGGPQMEPTGAYPPAPLRAGAEAAAPAAAAAAAPALDAGNRPETPAAPSAASLDRASGNP